MTKALVIVAQEGYQDEEFAGTKSGLEEGGFDVVVASAEEGECRGKFGGKVVATCALRDVRVVAYNRIAFIGGPGALAYVTHREALRIVRETVAAGKPLGAICIAPRIVAAAGVLHGKRATVWNGDGKQREFLEQCGAHYTGSPVTVDGLIVTADGPSSAQEFGRLLASL